MKKTCRSCVNILSTSEFYKDKSKNDGLSNKCKLCQKRDSEIWRKANKLKHNQTKKIWRTKNKEVVKDIEKRRYIRNRQDAYRKKSTGCSPELFKKLLERCGGYCDICGKTDKRSLSVDHCHDTNKIRGLLCNRCNRGLGHFEDSVHIMESALNYLKQTI